MRKRIRTCTKRNGRGIALLLAALMLFASPERAFAAADPTPVETVSGEDLAAYGYSAGAFAEERAAVEAEKTEEEERLLKSQEELASLEEAQRRLASEINAKDAQLVDILVGIEQTNVEIESANARVAASEAELRRTETKLSEAEESLAAQYEAMKRRIQYFYENAYPLGVFGTLLNGKWSSALERMDQLLSLEEADREALEAYRQGVREILFIKNRLAEEKNVFEAETKALEGRKDTLDAQNEELAQEIETLRQSGFDYDNRISAARAQAGAISFLIAQKNEKLKEIEEAEKAAKTAAEEAARKAAEEAARKAAEEAARRAAEEAARKEAEEARRRAQEEAARAAAEASRQAAEQNALAEARRRAAAKQEAEEKAAAEALERARMQAATPTPIPSTPTPFVTNAASKGQEIVNYACRFLGRPYVWGGSSLTNGCDCSHFVFLVLRDCGVYGGGYMTSGYWPGAGKPVASLSEAIAGDIICYPGHVAIYDGNGMIVEAKGSAYGITHDRRADCKPIVAIRRFT